VIPDTRRFVLTFRKDIYCLTKRDGRSFSLLSQSTD